MILDEADPDGQTLLVRYARVLPTDAYVRSEERIECGAKSALDPHVGTTVRPYVTDDVPDADLAVADVTTIQPTRTFWDKLVIVHGLRAWFGNRGELRQDGQRISRHYYDLHVMFHEIPAPRLSLTFRSGLNASDTPECFSTGHTSTVSAGHVTVFEDPARANQAGLYLAAVVGAAGIGL